MTRHLLPHKRFVTDNNRRHPCTDTAGSGCASALLAGFLLSALSVSGYALAETPKRYKVEMMVFSHEEADTSRSEQWPDSTQVELPTAYRQLYTPGKVPGYVLQRTQPRTENRAQQNAQGETRVVQVPVGPMPLSQAQRQALQNKRIPDLFYLPSKQRDMKRERYRISYRDEYRLLYHQAWNMPIHSKEDSIPLRIRGGKWYDKTPELEGSIRISVARYLHVDAQLYLREFRLNQQKNQDRLTQDNSSEKTSDNSEANRSLSMLGFRQHQVARAIPLQQSRRMRSRELHYIDHPRFGILIRITPL